MIVDDEPVAHDVIQGYGDLVAEMQLVKNCYDALDALSYLNTHTVDLIFLDLNMPKIQGFDFLRTLSHTPKVIVTTAYQEYALEGYELHIVDYLLKPFGFDRFLKAVQKVLTMSKPHPIVEVAKEAQTVFLYSDKKHIQITIEDVLYLEAKANYTLVVLTQQQLLIREKLSDAVLTFPDHMFIQVHKSYIVAKKHIGYVEGNRIRLGNHWVPIGKTFKNVLINLVKGD